MQKPFVKQAVILWQTKQKTQLVALLLSFPFEETILAPIFGDDSAMPMDPTLHPMVVVMER